MADDDGEEEEEKAYTVRLAEQGVTDPETMKAAAEAQAELHRERDTLEILMENVDFNEIVQAVSSLATVLQQNSREVGGGPVRRQAAPVEESRATEPPSGPSRSPNRPADASTHTGEEPADEE